MSTAWAEEITYNGSQADYEKYHGFLGAEGTFVT